MLIKDEINQVMELCDKAQYAPWIKITNSIKSYDDYNIEFSIIMRDMLPKLIDTIERQAEAIEVMREGLNRIYEDDNLLNIEQVFLISEEALEKGEKILGEVSE